MFLEILSIFTISYLFIFGMNIQNSQTLIGTFAKKKLSNYSNIFYSFADAAQILGLKTFFLIVKSGVWLVKIMMI